MSNKSKRTVSLVLTMVMALIMLSALTSCARQSDEEARAIVCDLIERSYNLNVAYYGSGLPCDENEHVEGEYYAVKRDAPFTIKNDLLIETRAVFSKEIADELISVYVDGAVSYGVVLHPRYITGYDGYLTVYKDYEYVVENVTKYDTSTVQIIKNRKNKIVASVSTSDYSSTIEVTFVFEPDGWRLDSMTY